MTRLFASPKRVYPTLVILLVATFALSAVGQTKGNSLSWIGDIGWIGFMLTILAAIIYSIGLLVRRTRRRATV